MPWFINDVYNHSDIVILKIEGFDYLCIISLVYKNEAIDLMQNADLTRKTEHYKEQKFILICRFT